MAFRNLRPLSTVETEIRTVYLDQLFEITILLNGVRVCVDENSIISLNSDGSVVSLIDEKHPVVQGVNNSRLRSLVRDYNKHFKKSIYLEGVVIGQNINDNPDKLVGQHFFLTDIFNRDTSDWVSPLNRSSSYMKKSRNSSYSEYQILLNYNIKRKSYLRMVPYYYQFSPFKKLSDLADSDGIMQKLRDIAPGPSFNPSARRKGLVFKNVNEEFAFRVEV